MKYNLRKMGYNSRILGEERKGKTRKGRLKDSELNDQLLKNLDQKQLKKGKNRREIRIFQQILSH